MPLTTTQRVAAAVAQALDAAEASLNATAIATDIPYSTLRRKVRGAGDFTLPELLAIAEHVGVNPSVFFDAALHETSAA